MSKAIADHANKHNVNGAPFIRYDYVACVPHAYHDKRDYDLVYRIKLQWWKPSYIAYLRGFMITDPAWIAWPLAIWFAIRYGAFAKAVYTK